MKLTSELSESQWKELQEKLIATGTANIKISRKPTAIELIIDNMFMEDYGVKFNDFDLEKSKLIEAK